MRRYRIGVMGFADVAISHWRGRRYNVTVVNALTQNNKESTMRFDGCQPRRRILGWALYALAGISLMGSSANAQEKSSADRVKVSATAGKIDATGNKS